MLFKKTAVKKPDRIVPLLKLEPGWWRPKDSLDQLAENICIARSPNRDEYTRFFSWPAATEPRLPKIDSLNFPHWHQAVDALLQIIQKQEPVLIFGDYDCDGICSVTLMADGLESAGLSSDKIHLFIPNRLKDRYGLTIPALKKALVACAVRPTMLIAVDCGSPHGDALVFLREQGIRTIVLDHHNTDAQGAGHAADYHLNPKGWPAVVDQTDLCEMCAAGLTFLFCRSLAEKIKDQPWDEDRATILAGLATCADVVPMFRANRELVKRAVSLCNGIAIPCTPLEKIPGLAALRENLSTNYFKKFARLPKVDENTFGYEWGPCINASGRLVDPGLSLALLREKSLEAAKEWAAQCVAMNRGRIYRQRKILAEAREQARAQVENDPPARVILVAGRHWNKGVVGIVAARLREEFFRPAIVCGWDETDKENPMWCGSGRSVADFDLGKYLSQAVTDKMITYGGGHKMAGGMSFTDRQRPDFQRWINEKCLVKDFSHVVEVVAANLEELTPDQWWSLIKKLRPFGQSHAATPIYLQNARLKKIRFSYFRNPGADELSENRVETERPEVPDGIKDSDCFAIGFFQSTFRPDKVLPYQIYWKDVSRVRREWRKGRSYTLELKIIRHLNESGRFEYRPVVIDCWPEADHQEHPRPHMTGSSLVPSPMQKIQQMGMFPKEFPFAWRL